jgi:hypothetical protein
MYLHILLHCYVSGSGAEHSLLHFATVAVSAFLRGQPRGQPRNDNGRACGLSL